ncbi:Oidioi.mRNA.OKI2018_I69.chr2.g6310.t1.cds [Oikopleura dioica]|uniref:Oidioi.mRNA.OKI2018_I69.chr2.g6310.t1.cds n=1 Tax=Oikopleura dioica TaxID=34765 RepID=A0ABN7T9N6_OIKDI|nr:Oidioi.mRNA.OKI2018_I69.chr2.g6310.t1.cds [Oikopleura dioica]
MTESPLIKPDKSYQFLDPFLEAETDKYCSEEMSLTEVTSVDLSAVSTADEAEDLNETVIEADFSDNDENHQNFTKNDQECDDKEIDSGIKIESKDEINLSNPAEEPSKIEEPDESLQKVGQTVVEEKSKSIVEEVESSEEAESEDDRDPELPDEIVEEVDSVSEEITEDINSCENEEREIEKEPPQIPTTKAPYFSESSDDEDLQDSAEQELENLVQSTDDEDALHSSLAPSRESPRVNHDLSGQTQGVLVNESDHVHLFFRITYFDSKF